MPCIWRSGSAEAEAEEAEAEAKNPKIRSVSEWGEATSESTDGTAPWTYLRYSSTTSHGPYTSGI